MHDLVIHDALLVDGLGNPPRQGSLAVAAGRIAAIGDVGRGRETVDAAGSALAPGIIDTHTHYDAQLTWDPELSSAPAVGVTTAVIGNCGFTLAPCRPADRDLVMRNLTQVEGMSLDALRTGIRWDFETFPDYLRALERGIGVNIAAFVGHSSVRTFVMGEAAARRAAQPTEIDAMRRLVAEALQAGAVGFATSTSPAHNGDGGLPMPSRLADEAEMYALTDALREAGHGVFMLTKGGHTRVRWLEEIAARNGRPVIVAALLHNTTNPDAVFADLAEIADANTRGRTLVGAVSCCPLTNEFTLAAPYPFEGLEAWRAALGLKGEAFKRVLADRAFRDALREELSRPATFRLFNGEWDKVYVVETAHEVHRALAQRSIAHIAGAARADPLDTLLDLALAEDLKTLFSATLLNADEDAVARLIKHPCSMVSLSDAGAHLSFFNDAGFGLHLLGHWVRSRGVLTLAEAVHKLTAEPARIFGIRDRGRLAVGCAADLMLFDPGTVGRGPTERRCDLPGGAARLMTPARGVYGVWVNGVRVLQDGAASAPSARAGKLLRDFAA